MASTWIGVANPLLSSTLTASPSITCRFGRRPPRSIMVVTLIRVSLLSHAGYTPTASSERKIQAMPTDTQPAKKDFEKMYLDPYIGMGQRTSSETALGSRCEQRRDIACQHRSVGAGTLDREGAARLFGRDQPGRNGTRRSEDGGKHGRPFVLAIPEQSKGGGNDSSRNEDTHEQIQVAHGDAIEPEADRDAANDESIDDHAHVRNPNQTLTAGIGAEICAINICGSSTAFAEQSHGRIRQGQTSRDVGFAHAIRESWESGARLQRQRRETESRGRHERNRQPCETTNDVARQRVCRVGRNGFVKVAVIQEDGAKVANNIDDEKGDAPRRAHGQVASALVARDRVSLARLDEQVVHYRGAAQDVGRCVRRQGKGDDDDEHGKAMDVVRDKGRLEAADEGVGDDGDGHEKDGRDGTHAGQGVDGGRAAGNEHQRHEDVGHDAVEDEDEVRRGAVARLDGLEEGVGVWGAPLERNGQRRKEQDLHRRARGVPEGTRHAVAVADAGALQESGGPGYSRTMKMAKAKPTPRMMP
ncbi:hypothetical protein LLEC1_02660 [Akanthomyces lecanii]|uniref:Uncharacterized protein n=1 Tax=Cordyceps confragosa TaxID=2714763 RepID=A0A179IDR5_CORDF|nr:hypothetical protein LLEC1_02660 [Akanthomyces lecanii]